MRQPLNPDPGNASELTPHSAACSHSTSGDHFPPPPRHLSIAAASAVWLTRQQHQTCVELGCPKQYRLRPQKHLFPNTPMSLHNAKEPDHRITQKAANCSDNLSSQLTAISVLPPKGQGYLLPSRHVRQKQNCRSSDQISVANSCLQLWPKAST